ncbi:variable large family protein, partial [Borrelia coriaceae]
LSCNNGIEELEKRNTFLSSLANLGNDFLSVFSSFGDIMTESLGFKADAKKSDVATYFKKVQDNLENTKTALNKIVEDMKTQENPNVVGVETAVKTLIDNTLDKIIQGSKTVSDAIGNDSELLGNVGKAAADQNAAGNREEGKVSNLINGIRAIVSIVLKNEGKLDAGDNNKALAASGQRDGTTDDAMLLFGNASKGNITANAEKAAVDAAKAVGAVTGADILKAMVENTDSVKLANADPKQAISTANVTAPKDATIAGAIALRAMAKGGKFANGNTGSDISTAVKGIAVNAVTKALDTLTIAIRKTIDEGLKTVKDAIKN